MLLARLPVLTTLPLSKGGEATLVGFGGGAGIDADGAGADEDEGASFFVALTDLMILPADFFIVFFFFWSFFNLLLYCFLVFALKPYEWFPAISFIVLVPRTLFFVNLEANCTYSLPYSIVL